MPEHNETNNQVQGTAKKVSGVVVKGFNAIRAAFTILFSSVGAFLGIIIVVLIAIASSIFLLVSLALGNDINVPDNFIDQNAVQTTINNQCKSDVDDTIKWMSGIYVEKSKDVSLLTKEYVVSKLGSEADSLPEPSTGFLGDLMTLFGVNNGAANTNLKDWKYVDYNESNRINLHFTRTYHEIGETLYGYVSATISALDNYENAYKVNDKCGTTGCTQEEFFEDDYDLPCENTAQGCSLTEILNAMRNEKKQTVKEVLSEQSNAANSNAVFYIDDTFSDWQSDLRIEEWEVEKTVEGSCQVFSQSEQCPDSSKEGYHEVSREAGVYNDPADPANTGQTIYTVRYQYIEKETKRGPVGDIYVPIYVNADEFLKDKKKEIVDIMLADRSMPESEATEQLNDYINSSFESSMTLCGFTPDYSIFGSTDLIGIGNNGLIGELPLQDFSIYAGMDPFDPALNASVWGEAIDFINQGKIRALKRHQCTTFVKWMFYKVYGYDCASGNGNQMAQNLVNQMPDKFMASNSPAPGAVASVGMNTTYGHVLFINAVYDDDGDGNWDRIVASDGNIDGTVQDTGVDGVRIMFEYSREEFTRRWSPVYYAVPK